MDRRTLLKSSGLLLGGLLIERNLFASPANLPQKTGLVPTQNQPLLLNFNENSLGMSPAAKEAITHALHGAFRYPDAAREALIDAISAHHHVDPSQIILGNGSSEVIRATLQGLAQPYSQSGKSVQLIVPDPTFDYAQIYAASLNITVTKVPLTQDLEIDLAKMAHIAAEFPGHSIAYLCNPNNPTATILNSQKLKAWIEKCPHIDFILDEAYAEFVTDPMFISGITLLKSSLPNIVVTRTFSKLYALAGLRIGYGIATANICQRIMPFLSLDNTNTAGAAAALASLNDHDFIQLSQKTITTSRQIVEQTLDALNLRYLPSQANFIFHQIQGNVAQYQARMKSHHIFVGREFKGAAGWNRLTLGTPAEMQQFVKVLKQFRQNGWV